MAFGDQEVGAIPTARCPFIARQAESVSNLADRVWGHRQMGTRSLVYFCIAIVIVAAIFFLMGEAIGELQ